MCVPVSPCSALLKRINMLALQQITAPTDCAPNDDNNNTCLSPSALKALTKPKSGLRRCLFGVPKAEDNAKIIQEDREANRARMAKLWSWDVTKDAPETSGGWVWERMKRSTSTPLARKSFAPVSEHRHHPYPGAVRVERTSSGSSLYSTTINLQVPAMISPIPPTPRCELSRVRRSSTSSTSSTSSPSSDEDEVESSELSTLSPPSSSSETWSPRFTAQISCSVKVQTRLTDFWRNRRSSCSDSKHVKTPALTIQKNIRSGEMACSV